MKKQQPLVSLGSLLTIKKEVYTVQEISKKGVSLSKTTDNSTLLLSLIAVEELFK